MSDGIKVRILKQYNKNVVVDTTDRGGSIGGTIQTFADLPLHKHGAVGEVVTLSTSVANDLIAKGWAVAV